MPMVLIQYKMAEDRGTPRVRTISVRVSQDVMEKMRADSSYCVEKAHQLLRENVGPTYVEIARVAETILES